MKHAVLAFMATLAVILTATGARAQLLSDRVFGDQRVCIYVGSDQGPGGQTTPRHTIVPSAQPCPDISPYRDPNRPIPGNANLARETTQNGQRQCIYAQGGVEYARTVPLGQRCAMTPDLLDRAVATRDPGTLAR